MRTKEAVSVTCSGVAVFPVPMAHTGSYASTTFPQSFTFSATHTTSPNQATTFNIDIKSWTELRQEVEHMLHRAINAAVDFRELSEEETLQPLYRNVSISRDR